MQVLEINLGSPQEQQVLLTNKLTPQTPKRAVFERSLRITFLEMQQSLEVPDQGRKCLLCLWSMVPVSGSDVLAELRSHS